jgi:hypothetical protein
MNDQPTQPTEAPSELEAVRAAYIPSENEPYRTH